MMEKNSRGQRDEYALGAAGHFDWRKGFEEVSSSRRFIVLEMERRGVEWNCGGVGVWGCVRVIHLHWRLS